MRVGLFVPCYVDAFEPEVGIATLELLERVGLHVEYPFDQTCCGQPMANTGCHAEAAATEALFVKNFSDFDYVVAPSGSCVHQVREHLTAIPQTDEVKAVRRQHLRTRRVPARRAEDRGAALGGVPAQGRLSRQLQRATRHPPRPAVRDREAVLLEAPRPASPGEGRRARRPRRGRTSAAASAAPSRCSSPPSRPRWATTRSPTRTRAGAAVRRLGRFLVPDAPEGLRRAPRPAAQATSTSRKC